MLPKGLSEKQVLRRREKFGENLILSKEKTTWFSILLSQLKSPLIYILIVIGFISLFFQEYFDLILIWSVIVLNTLMGFFQEYHVKKTLAALRKLLKPKALVVREGRRKEIEARELVPGDLVILNSGDKVPADNKKEINDKIEALKKVKDGQDKDVIKKASDELSKAAQKIGEILYKAAQEKEAKNAPKKEEPKKEGPIEGEVVKDK